MLDTTSHPRIRCRVFRLSLACFIEELGWDRYTRPRSTSRSTARSSL